MRLNIPTLDDAELKAVGEVLATGMLTQGAQAARLEQLMCELTGASRAAAVSSATTGLHLALVALGVGPTDEVIMPAFSFPATANVVVQQGARPVFADIDPVTFNIRPDLIEAAVTSRTKAVMPVHAFGLCAEMDAINEVAGRHGLPVIEDAACAVGGTFRGRAAGSMGTAGVFSFHPRKVITTGEGGMITTSDEALADQLNLLRAHGARRGELFMEFVEAGFNYRLSDIHAAIGVVQMGKLLAIVAERQRLAAALSSRLVDIEGVTVPSAPSHVVPTFQSYVVRLDDLIDRDGVIRSLRELDIESTLGTYGMHLQPYFQKTMGDLAADLPNATQAHHQALTLPLYPGLADGDLDQIATALRAAVAKNRRSAQPS
ncbi:MULTISPECIES: DegT/DnrJ/EryC1/StrS family aminotransferase [unclassified Nocardioides]|uniref:DegT/DnrJ/EryC1/StrS family aminotransferase n=1 Tax=unclassified Nocardioides TaxID=2615069 RepID=UPI0006F4B09A|nr:MULTISPECIES: DegT/DnrJ/EryC1/StrS family aminotransferase [unclassified Nocardioides]KRA29938.1 hypothetical protein ASD81_19770 [Nocardioides sp. Root614]KRA86859.1 hypothetical protein ASD84_21985 [Nocardioides sp. Root682]